MLKKIFNYFFDTYCNENLLLQKKVKVLIIFTMIMAASNSLLVILLLIADPTGFIPIISISVSTSCFIISLVLLKKKRYQSAVNISVFPTLGGIFFGMIVSSSVGVLQILFFYTYLLIFTLLITDKYYQLTTVFVVSFLHGVYQFINLALNSPEFNQETTTNSIAGLVIYALIFAFIMLIHSITLSSIREAEKELRDNKARAEKVRQILDSSKESLEVGEHLKTTSEKLSDYMKGIDESIQQIKNQIFDFNDNIKILKEVTDGIDQSADNVDQIIMGQNASISQSSAAIEEMSGNINTMTESSVRKKELVSNLLESSNMTEKEQKQSVESINKIMEGSNKIIEIMKVIISIAARTNLLAMNAAIEAAHAGDYGRGFAVVAEEIRNLAENTNENSKIIKEVIIKNNSNVLTASDINQKSNTYFKKIMTEIVEVSQFVEEIITGMTELNIGANELLKSISYIVNKTSVVTDSVKEMKGNITTGIDSISRIAVRSDNIQVQISTISQNFDQIIGIISNIREIGATNSRNIKKLTDEIDSVK